MHRPFLFLSVLTSDNTAETAHDVNRTRAADLSPSRAVDLTTTDGSTATVRIRSFDHDGLQVSYDDGRVRRVSYDAIDTIECNRSNGGIRVIAVGGELAILTGDGAQPVGSAVH
ncbi:MAG: hypothetical protein AAGA44_00680 [Pseudomonadota bacterium]